MAWKPVKSRRPKKADIKAAADRAEKRARGEKIEDRTDTVLDPPEVHPGGRPTEYKAEFCDVAANACARGATIAEVAEIIGVYRSTIYRWMAQHQEFSDAIRIAREIADERVGFSMYERAVGYSYNAVKILQSDGVPLIVPYVEHVPPDVGAGKFWLTNRQPDQWKERSSREVSGPGGGPIEVATIDKMALARWIALQLSSVEVGEQKQIA